MSNNEWVQEGTPRDDAEWTEEADDYGVPVEPAEWDDYSDEQAMPVPPRPVQPEPEPEPEGEEAVEVAVENQPTAPDPDEVLAAEDEPVVVEEPGLEEEQVDIEAKTRIATAAAAM
ncbi:MAG: hypothetical protein Q4G35_07050, partial [Propionibacteriaceae bacterium]|nr:hypothetical protein [Propionibacteriaceae bacterium]